MFLLLLLLLFILLKSYVVFVIVDVATFFLFHFFFPLNEWMFFGVFGWWRLLFLMTLFVLCWFFPNIWFHAHDSLDLFWLDGLSVYVCLCRKSHDVTYDDDDDLNLYRHCTTYTHLSWVLCVENYSHRGTLVLLCSWLTKA